MSSTCEVHRLPRFGFRSKTQEYMFVPLFDLWKQHLALMYLNVQHTRHDIALNIVYPHLVVVFLLIYVFAARVAKPRLPTQYAQQEIKSNRQVHCNSELLRQILKDSVFSRGIIILTDDGLRILRGHSVGSLHHQRRSKARS